MKASPRLTHQQRRRAACLWFVAFVLEPELFPEEPPSLLTFEEELAPETFRAFFCFESRHIRQLRVGLGIPDRFTASEHTTDGDTALLMLLRRLTSHQRHVDLADEFECSTTKTSVITLGLVHFLRDRWTTKLWTCDFCWQPEQLERYAQAIARKMHALTGQHWPAEELMWHIVGFLDGTFIGTNRPSRVDPNRGDPPTARFYSASERAHGVRMHHILFPCGIIGHVSNLVPAGESDADLCEQSWYVAGVALECVVLC